MKTASVLVVLSGASGCGKTTLCAGVTAAARARGLAVAGLLTLPSRVDGRQVGLEVEDLSSGERRPLAQARVEPGPGAGLATEGWRFDPEGLAWGTRALKRASPCDVLVIDELGPLELVRNRGWTAGLDALRAGRYRLALAVVRPSLLSRFQERLGTSDFSTLTVTQDNRSALAHDLTDLVIAVGESRSTSGREIEG
jgi:nucleoside-triphosphatase